MYMAKSLCVLAQALSLSKSLFDKLSNGKRFAGFPFEKAARCFAHKFRAVRRISALASCRAFCLTYTPPDKTNLDLFRRARWNSTRF